MNLVDILFLGSVTIKVFLCPYTKVEESFVIQATHDILKWGFVNPNFDHFEFPGVVPRTFTGPLYLSAFTRLIQKVLEYMGYPLEKNSLQIVARLILGWTLVYSNSRLRETIKVVYGKKVSFFYIVICASQFHTSFWGSRTIGNTFALVFTMEAIRCFIYANNVTSQHYQRLNLRNMVRWLLIAIVFFRFDVSVFALPLVLISLLSRKASVKDILLWTIKPLLLSLMVVVLIDSYYWDTKFMWPEANVFYFNAILNKSSLWGTSPWHTYFSLYLPKILMGSVPLVFIGVYTSSVLWNIFIPTLVSISIFSALPHKEWRFIIYSIPVFNICAAYGAQKLRQFSSFLKFVSRAFVIMTIVLNIVATISLTFISILNYPGGEAFALFHKLERKANDDVYSSMTGVTRFGELRDDWSYSKEENLLPTDYTKFTHLLTHNSTAHADHFDVIGVVDGYDGILLSNIKELFNTKNL
ncbi:hypothetical protein BB559_002202 [Furculomyces boomerangus]|uniref:Mannosyltransferase n=2 Tax=Harpellales TaxID=61421 RepID=A0A2T9YX52_9FUNG|nr:hypothetical protein BB559_002202 [Furculomyces boomerangus]PVZ99566.1 hypothetical protein BB558_004444 [Smittium angustum]